MVHIFNVVVLSLLVHASTIAMELKDAQHQQPFDVAAVPPVTNDNNKVLTERFSSDDAVMAALSWLPRYSNIFLELIEKADKLDMLSEFTKKVLIHHGVLDATGTQIIKRFEQAIVSTHELAKKIRK